LSGEYDQIYARAHYMKQNCKFRVVYKFEPVSLETIKIKKVFVNPRYSTTAKKLHWVSPDLAAWQEEPYCSD